MSTNGFDLSTAGTVAEMEDKGTIVLLVGPDDRPYLQVLPLVLGLRGRSGAAARPDRRQRPHGAPAGALSSVGPRRDRRCPTAPRIPP